MRKDHLFVGPKSARRLFQNLVQLMLVISIKNFSLTVFQKFFYKRCQKSNKDIITKKSVAKVFQKDHPRSWELIQSKSEFL